MLIHRMGPRQAGVEPAVSDPLSLACFHQYSRLSRPLHIGYVDSPPLINYTERPFIRGLSRVHLAVHHMVESNHLIPCYTLRLLNLRMGAFSHTSFRLDLAPELQYARIMPNQTENREKPLSGLLLAAGLAFSGGPYSGACEPRAPRLRDRGGALGAFPDHNRIPTCPTRTGRGGDRRGAMHGSSIRSCCFPYYVLTLSQDGRRFQS